MRAARRRTSIEIDPDKVVAAREILGTETLTDTVDSALTEVVELGQLRQSAEGLVSKQGDTAQRQRLLKEEAMVEKIEDMPAGTIGFSAAGKLSRDDYKQVLEPVLREAADAGEIRMLFRLTEFDGLEPSAWFEDLKTGLGLGIGHHSAWKRSAIVTDVEWVGKAFKLFAWMTPGEVEVFRLEEIERAKAWVAA